MPAIELQLPSALSPVMQGRLALTLEADTLRGALEAIKRQHPELALHLFDETGDFRRHVLCFLNETNTRWLDTPDVALKPGDTLLVMQAVSGG